VLIRITEEDHAAAGNAVHHGTIRFRTDIFHGFFVIPSVQRGTDQTAVVHQRGTEQIRKEDGETARQTGGSDRQSLDPGDHGPDKDPQQNCQHREEQDQTAFQLPVYGMLGLFGIEGLHFSAPLKKRLPVQGKAF
jgi:hypothetical protein